MAVDTHRVAVEIGTHLTGLGAPASLGKEIDGLKRKVLEAAAVFAAGFAFKNIIDETRQWYDSVDVLSRSLGVSAERASQMAYVGKTVGMTADDMALAFGRLGHNIDTEREKIAQGTSMFDRWGVKVTDAKGAMLPFEQVMNNLNLTIGAMTDGLTKDAAEMELFGRSGMQMNQLLSLNGATVQALTDEMRSFGLEVGEAGSRQMVAFERSTRRMDMGLQGLKVTIGTAILPVLADLVQRFIAFFKAAEPVFRDVIAPLFLGLLDLAGALAGLAIAVGRAVAAIFGGVTGMNNANTAAKNFGEALRRLASLIKDLTGPVERFRDAIGTKGLAGALGDLVFGIGDKVTKFLGDIGEWLDKNTTNSWLWKGALAALLIAISLLVESKLLGWLGDVLFAVGKSAAGFAALVSAMLIPALVIATIFLVVEALLQVKETVELVQANWDKFVFALKTGQLSKIPVLGFLFDLIKDVVSAVDNFRIGDWGDLVKDLGKIVAKIPILNLLSGLLDTVGTLINDVRTDNWAAFWTDLTKAITDIPILGGVLRFLGEIKTAILDFETGDWAGMKKALGEAAFDFPILGGVLRILQGIKTVMEWIINNLGAIGGAGAAAGGANRPPVGPPPPPPPGDTHKDGDTKVVGNREQVWIDGRWNDAGPVGGGGGTYSGGDSGGSHGNYDEGGLVPGPLGAPQRATVHGGEFVLTPGMMRGGAAGRSLTINMTVKVDASTASDRRAGEKVADQILSRVLRAAPGVQW